MGRYITVNMDCQVNLLKAYDKSYSTPSIFLNLQSASNLCG
jgi:hypothetical protein